MTGLPFKKTPLSLTLPDRLMYQVYGLTETEIAIVEGRVG
jgi:hypothetical protein